MGGFGLLVVLFGVTLPESLSHLGEGLVGLTLVALGVLHLVRSGPLRAFSSTRSLLLGALHGMAGSGGLVLLVSSTAASPEAAFAYLGVFATGTIAGMLVVSLVLFAMLRWSSSRPALVAQTVHAVAAFSSIVLGLMISVRAVAP